MAGSLMLASIYAEDDGDEMLLVDLGYVNDRRARDRADAIRAFGIGRQNFSIEGNARLMFRVPPTKARRLFDEFPIVPGSTYWRSTHHWRGLADGERVASISSQGDR